MFAFTCNYFVSSARPGQDEAEKYFSVRGRQNFAWQKEGGAAGPHNFLLTAFQVLQRSSAVSHAVAIIGPSSGNIPPCQLQSPTSNARKSYPNVVRISHHLPICFWCRASSKKGGVDLCTPQSGFLMPSYNITNHSTSTRRLQFPF